MIDLSHFGSRSVRMHGSDPLQDARDLQDRIRNLTMLLEVQRRQFEVLSERCYSNNPGGIAARRLMALKRVEKICV